MTTSPEPGSGLQSVVPLLACPVCGRRFSLADRSLVCAAGHSFDIARQGQVNLLGHAAPRNADSAEMVAARLAFLSAGWYGPIAEALARRASGARRILDAGSGPGWYLARVLDRRPDAVGIAADVSPAAARRAARAHPRIGAIVADTWRTLPVRDGCVDAVLCVFAPRNAAEFARVLSPGGLLLVVSPGPDHLAVSRERLGLLGIQDDKHSAIMRAMSGAFEAVVTTTIRETLELDATSLRHLVDMGPNAFHNHAEITTGVTDTLEVHLDLFRKPSPR